MADDLTFREARPADAPALFEAHRDSVLHLCASAYTPLQMSSWFEGRSHGIYGQALVEGKVWLAERSGRVMGFVAFEPGEVTLLFVRPEAAGAGLGSRLLSLGMARAQQGSSGPVSVLATRNAVAFYQRHGFVAVREETMRRGSAQVAVEMLKMQGPGPAPLRLVEPGRVGVATGPGYKSR